MPLERTPPGADQRTRTRLVWLMAARLVLALVCLVLALGVDGLGPELSPAARRGLYWTVAFAFLATVVHSAWFGRIRQPVRFAAVQVATDIGIATSLVYYSGGRGSIFTFLYVLVAVYGAVLFRRRGAMAAAAASALAYGAVLLSTNQGWLPDLADAGPVSLSSLAAWWGVHAGALFTVGLLASALSRELQETGQALNQSRSDLDRLRNLHERTIDSLMSGLLTTDPAGRVTSFNPEAERITGVTAGEALGLDAESVIPGLRELVLSGEAGDRDGGPRRARTTYRNRRDEALHLGLAGSILRDAEGDPAGYVVIFQDVTRVVAMERELQRSERMAAVGELAAKIAHEIRNPLAAISGSIQILGPAFEREGSGEEEPRRLVDIVLRETDRLNDLIGDFLHYARPRPLRREVVDIGALVEDVGRMLEASLPEDVELSVDTAPGLQASADPDQLRQVLWNLCRNGVQAMPQGGVLRMSAAVCAGPFPQGAGETGRNPLEGRSPAGPPAAGADAGVEICVVDGGEGIPVELHGRIFEPFFTTKQEGSGLGLATVHRIVENHGGILDLRSEAGRGAEFRIRLPREESS